MHTSFFIAVAAAAACLSAAQLTVSFDGSKPLHTVGPKFLSFNIDTGSIYNGFNFVDPVLINIARQLGPSVIRIGGTAADYSYYIPDATVPGDGHAHTYISNKVLDDIATFIIQSNNTLLWDFNGLTFRDQTTKGPWDPTGNATATLQYWNSKYGGQVEWAWSLGNEPELWPKPAVTISQLAADALTLSKVLPNYNLGQEVYGSSFAGVSSTEATTFLSGTKDWLTGLTVHDYPLTRLCNVSEFLNKQHVEGMAGRLRSVAAAKEQVGSSALLVLEETAACYGGGCENITDRFASGFYYVPAFSVVASSGFDRMHRQDIAGWSFTGGQSHYQLAGPAGWTNGSSLLTPHPDWFTSVLFKQIHGSSILNTTVSGNAIQQENFRADFWCASNAGNSVAFIWVNLGGSDVPITIQGVPAAPRTEFTLTSTAAGYGELQERIASGSLISSADPLDPPASLQNDQVYLNGQLMTVDGNGVLPQYPIQGKVVSDPSAPLVAGPYSYGFVVFQGAAPAACN